MAAYGSRTMSGISAFVNFRDRSITRGVVTIRFSKVTFRLLSVLLASRGPVRFDTLAEHAYWDDVEGGPDDAGNAIRAVFWRLRHGTMSPHMDALGLRVEGCLGRWNLGYRVLSRR
jgi:hypothetical protein